MPPTGGLLLVTGASGYVGGRLLERELHRRGFDAGAVLPQQFALLLG